ncbi:MAG: SulP family inorganic anion transporter [Treponema succinifaciens]|nr:MULTISPECIES: SulP family inorganic anion transporter [Treponema]MCI6911915.1 SulP family inorganic anion transporter [Treponema succinifaciens]MDD6962825.1 SulP family inorganic anion transporter [Treponema succinifaciens]MDY2615792.1 SulP family inorganic anion transporter [Treponema succinifaciens]MDY5116651.1 SulP family inorganic anion transporter [Treponema succinifaciens]
MFKPEILNTLKKYSSKTFLNDLTAGIIVGIVALPLAIAFAIASGVEPERGLFTAIIAGFFISLLGGSRVQIGGPTGAFAVIVYGVVAKYGYSGLAAATVMAGILLIMLGAFKMGGLVKFIPYTIVTGFTAGIAVTIATGQIGDFLGLSISVFPEGFSKMPGNFVGKIETYAMNITHINYYSLIMASVCLALIFIWPHFCKKIPGSLIVIILATAANILLKKYTGLETDTIGSRYGSIPSTLPSPLLPQFSVETITALFPTSISIAVLAAIESLLSAVVADGMTGTKHDSDTELIAQGIANIASPIFGGIPATGAIARTATNIKNGGKTPVAGIIHAITLLLIMLILGKYAVYIPMAALSAVLINVSWNMAGFPAVKALLKGQKSDIFVLAATFLITVFIDLTVAIEFGLGFAAFFFIKKMIDVSEVQNKRDSIAGGISGNEFLEENIEIPESAVVYEIDGPLFFGTVRKFEFAIERAGANAKVLILRMQNMIYIDAGGIRALEQAKAACDKNGITIVISGIHTQPYILFSKMGMIEKLGKENICADIKEALSRTNQLLVN